ncbi:leucine-rich repeat domain-containing protein, partial [Candidatus Berkelbacteria bacterium]|nr:leucine-rich repeat domain-containing protein [Candidatus Berkelbacteria bacterium]
MPNSTSLCAKLHTALAQWRAALTAFEAGINDFEKEGKRLDATLRQNLVAAEQEYREIFAQSFVETPHGKLFRTESVTLEAIATNIGENVDKLVASERAIIANGRLQELSLRDTQIKDLPGLAQLTNLQTLDLGNTQIKDLPDLAQLTNLQELDLGNTQIKDLPDLAQLTNLQWLYLSNTQIKDLPDLAQLTNLQTLDLGNT